MQIKTEKNTTISGDGTVTSIIPIFCRPVIRHPVTGAPLGEDPGSPTPQMPRAHATCACKAFWLLSCRADILAWWLHGRISELEEQGTALMAVDKEVPRAICR